MSERMKPKGVGAGETFLNRAVNAIPLGKPLTDVLATGVLQGAKAFGLGDPDARLTPEAALALELMGEDVRGANRNSIPDVVDTYRNVRDTRDERTETGSEENPWAGRLGTATGVGLSLLAPLPKVAPKGQGTAGAALPMRPISNPGVWQAGEFFSLPSSQVLSQRALSGLLTGAGYGALSGLTNGKADLTRGEVLEGAGDAAKGALLGAGTGAALPALVPSGLAGVIAERAPSGGIAFVADDTEDNAIEPPSLGLQGMGVPASLESALAKLLQRAQPRDIRSVALTEEQRRQLIQQAATADALHRAKSGG